MLKFSLLDETIVQFSLLENVKIFKFKLHVPRDRDSSIDSRRSSQRYQNEREARSEKLAVQSSTLRRQFEKLDNFLDFRIAVANLSFQPRSRDLPEPGATPGVRGKKISENNQRQLGGAGAPAGQIFVA